MRTGDTIVAVASARGVSRRASVRLSGPSALDACRCLCLGLDASPRAPGAPGAPGARAACLSLPGRSGGTVTLHALLTLWRAPRSYTGEDCAELLIPGNASLVSRVVDALCASEGVRPAEPGEFTARAFLHGKMSLDEAEGVAALIAATSESARRAAERTLAGRAGEALRAWRDEAADLLALVEAGIDFTDQEDVVPIAPRDLASRLDPLGAAIAHAIGPIGAREATTQRPRVALVGPPNAGKSTLFNALLGRRRAVVSDRPGTTRDAIAERLALDHGVEVDLVDLAGLDAALASRSPVDAISRKAALDEIARADAIVLCDPAGAFERASWLPPEVDVHARPVLRVRTKADLPAAAPSGDTIDVCALDGHNLGALRGAIADAAMGGESQPASDLIPRHRFAAARALASCVDARGLVDADAHALRDAELIADALRLALDALGDATGQITPDEVLGRIFGSFCIGK